MINKGKYVLIIKISRDLQFNFSKKKIGASLSKGIYLYIGSAMGPGGLEKRLARHKRKNKKLKWHIDYLTTQREATPIGSLVIKSNIPEAAIVEKLLKLQDFKIAIKGFGSTDSKAISHLLKYMDGSIEKLVEDLKKIFNGFYLKFDTDI